METQSLSESGALFFGTLIQSYIDAPHFVARPWLADRIEAAMRAPECRFVLLTGAPGAGKTALLAWLASQHSDWPRYFIRRDSREPLSSGDTRSFLFTIGHQLAARHPTIFRSEQIQIVVDQRVRAIPPGGRVIGIRVDDLVVSPFHQTALKVEQLAAIVTGELVGLSSGRVVVEPRFTEPQNLQYLALLDPAEALLRVDPAARIVILIDALDELRSYRGQDTILDWLADCPQLPPNLRIVIASRPEALLDLLRQRQGSSLVEVRIDQDSAPVQADLRAYACAFLAQPRMRDALAAIGATGDDPLDRLVRAGEGNFQYLATLFRGIDRALQAGDQPQVAQLLRLEAIPAGLEELYAYFLTALKQRVADLQIESAWEGLYQPILGVLSVAREPLPAPQIVALSGLAALERRLYGALAQLGQFLERDQGGYRLYHSTLPEFLTAAETRDRHPACYLPPGEWHRAISDSYLMRFRDRWDQCDSYGLSHVIEHVVAADADAGWRETALDALLSDSFTDAIFEHYGWLSVFVEDLMLVAQVDPARAAAQCLKLLRATNPNSLLMQQALRMLVSMRPRTGNVGNRSSSTDRAINEVVHLLAERPDDLLAQLTALLSRTRGKPARSTIALALGETVDPAAREPLLQIFKTARRGGSWAAADALIALNDPTVAADLLAWYDTAPDDADRHRILYVLGRMHADAARSLLDKALASHDWHIVGRGVDLFQLLPARPGDAERLLALIQMIVQRPSGRSRSLGPWGNMWVQKRLVRALHKTQATSAHALLEQLQAHLAARRPEQTKYAAIERRELEGALRIALRDLAPADDLLIRSPL